MLSYRIEKSGLMNLVVGVMMKHFRMLASGFKTEFRFSSKKEDDGRRECPHRVDRGR